MRPGKLAKNVKPPKRWGVAANWGLNKSHPRERNFSLVRGQIELLPCGDAAEISFQPLVNELHV
jgi:hypothetical protein